MILYSWKLIQPPSPFLKLQTHPYSVHSPLPLKNSLTGRIFNIVVIVVLMFAPSRLQTGTSGVYVNTYNNLSFCVV